MTVWATKRRFVYGGSVLLALSMIFGVVFWKIIYRAPTCSDGLQNGGETGIDCGGSCKNLCTSDALIPVLLWAKAFHISGNLYTATAYIQNPNINSRNENAAYEFDFYDANNKLIQTKTGVTSIPKNKKFAVFETGLNFPNTIPKRTEFQFTQYGPWVKDGTKEPEVVINYSSLLFPTTTPKITGTISNSGTAGIPETELDAFVLDGKENVVASSRSYIENLAPNSSQDFVFTWPQSFDLGVESCVNPVDIALNIDRSGSMKSEGANPPEPFTTVKNTAENFVNNLTSDDQVALFSFGNNSISSVSFGADNKTVYNSLVMLQLSSTTQEQTNITAALVDSFNELQSPRARDGVKKAIILLTDGIPTVPTDPKIPNYPSSSAQQVAEQIKNSNIEIFTIGLGSNVDHTFLKSISTDDSHYFFAPTKDTLSNIYSKIGSSLCPRKPNVITILYRFL